MSTKRVETTTCDECGKAIEGYPDRRHDTYIRPPPDPWLHVSISGSWQTSFNDAVKTSRDACSVDCATKMLRKILEKLEKAKALEERIG